MRFAIDALEPRRLLAFDQSFTDVDGDVYRVEVIGNGTAVVTTLDDGPTDNDLLTGSINQLAVTGTDTSSRLRVTVTQSQNGDGRVTLVGLSASVLKSASLAPVDSLPGDVLTFADVGQLAFGNVGSGSDVDLNAGAPATNLGTRTVTFGVIGFQLTITNGLRAVKITATSVGNAQFTLPQGAGTIVTTGDTRIFFDAGASINEIRVGGFATLRGTINGDVRKVSAGSFGPSSTSPLTVTGLLGTLTATGDLAAPFVAGRFGAINAGSLTGSEIHWTAPDVKGIAIKSLRVTGDIANAFIGPDENATGPGTISSLKVAGITNSQIDAGAITTLSATGGINAAGITLLNPTGVVSKTFKVVGRIVDTAIEAEHTAGFASVQALGLQGVSWQCGFVTSLALGLGAEGGMRDSFILFFGAGSSGYALKTAKLGETMLRSALSASGGTGRFGAVSGRVAKQSDIIAFTIDSITATGTPGVPGRVFENMLVNAFGDPVTRPSIGLLDVRGEAERASIYALGTINQIKIASLPPSDFAFGVVAGASVEVLDMPADLNGLNPAARIDRITISGPLVLGAPTFSSAFFVAPTIGSVTVKGLINTTGVSDGGDPFGFGARTFGNITLKGNDGATVKPDFPFGPGDYGGLPGETGNFLIRLYA